MVLNKNVIYGLMHFKILEVSSLFDLLGLIGLIIIGLVIIFVVRLLFVLIPAALVAFVVWFFTRSLWWAGVAFLVIAALSIFKKL
ncbi:hypothetical protein CW707_03445 [Candidatus Bathyarchaeota archaeon]|nr:MAG: hypothetical protein CW667_05610 [Candidatus Bathyarchaeota archaeon]RJS81475.1 MAG: hypothetical protein CW707_03445 [Candidatus Bathyarchaeota archaeon]